MYRSWAYKPDVDQRALRPHWRDSSFTSDINGTLLPFGNGRSYGDTCLNSAGHIIDSRNLNNVISFDQEQGVLRCEAGIIFEDILRFIVPAGWFLPVTPGTKYVTMGGAVANDVHGKNHHHDGSLGCHIRAFELMRSNDEHLICSPQSNVELFSATIGGLGLTGFIKWVEIQLIPINSDSLDVEIIPFHGLDEFYQLSDNSKQHYKYTVAWIDCIAQGNNFMRGLFMRANHAEKLRSSNKTKNKTATTIPFNFPKWSLNKHSIRIFNSIYFNVNRYKNREATQQHYNSYFYPLDGLNEWYRIYGKDGFYQYQFVIPRNEPELLKKIFNKITSSGLGSFLAVLKEFGDISSPGMLSFPRPGICLALDFSHRPVTRALLDELDELVMSVGGAVYPAKDVRMSSLAFKKYFPRYKEFAEYVDPRYSSDFWERVNV